METKLDRRVLLKRLGLALGLGLLTTGNKAQAFFNNCGLTPTPKQPLGPFYPVSYPIDSNADLTFVDGKLGKALGQIIFLSGIVSDESCKPIKGAVVEIWQACISGRYNHPSDTSDNILDNNFQYFGRVITNEKGEYLFKTIKPGSYVASGDWVRPPHIHFKVSLRGYQELVTQSYFAGDSLNAKDEILRRLPLGEQDKVVIDFKSNDKNEIVGVFNITLKRL